MDSSQPGAPRMVIRRQQSGQENSPPGHQGQRAPGHQGHCQPGQSGQVQFHRSQSQPGQMNQQQRMEQTPRGQVQMGHGQRAPGQMGQSGQRPQQGQGQFQRAQSVPGPIYVRVPAQNQMRQVQHALGQQRPAGLLIQRPPGPSPPAGLRQVTQSQLRVHRRQFIHEQKELEELMKTSTQKVTRQTPGQRPLPAIVENQEPEDPEVHKKIIEELRERYLEVVESMLRRENFPPGVRNVLEVLTGKPSTYKISNASLQRLRVGLDKLMTRDFLTFPTLDELRKVGLKRKLEENPLEDDSWQSVRHLEIRVPEAVRRLTERRMVAASSQC